MVFSEPAIALKVSDPTKSDEENSASSSKETVGNSNERHKALSASKSSRVNSSAHMNKSTDTAAKKQCLRSRTRSLDHVKTSDMKDVSAKKVQSKTKQSDVKAGRSRTQSAERDIDRKSSATKSQPRMKLTIPHTPQLLK